MTMIDQETIRGSLGSLIGWLESWQDDSGAYNGFVVHRTETKRMGRVHDTVWTQSAMIRGYANLYRRGGDPRWHTAMIEAVDLLLSRYDPETGRIRNTGHEDDRFQSLVSCALAIRALLSVYDLLDETRKGRCLHAAIDHVGRYWLDTLWVESEGAFKVSENDFYSPGEDRFIVNFNMVAVEAMMLLYRRTDNPLYRHTARRIGEWLLGRWEQSREYNDRILKGHTTVADDPRSEWMAPGGMPYQFTDSPRDPDNYVILYTGLSLPGYMFLYNVTKDERFVEIAREQSEFILAMRDPDTRLFFHTTRKGRIEKNPQFIAGAGMALSGLYETRGLIGDRAIPYDTVEAILGRVHANGSFPGFIGKNDTGHRRRDGGGVVWEDVAASVNWNAQLFEYLTLLVEEADRIEVRPCDRTVGITTSRFIYRDTPEKTKIISWWPPRSWGIYLYTKKRDIARFAFSPIMIYRDLLSRLRRPG
jgi:hypothetical protein